MTRYDIIVEALQDKVDNGELTLEDADTLNDIAYNKYITEGFDERLDALKDFKKEYKANIKKN